MTLSASFDLYDINGDGTITREEFRRILSSFIKYKGESVTSFSGKTYTNIDEICEECFSEMDKDGDGEISFEEYKEGVMKNPVLLSIVFSNVLRIS